MSIEQVEQHKCFDGIQAVYVHQSEATASPMRFAVYHPPVSANQKTAVLYWLSGLTCTEQNFITKAGAQRLAAQLELTLVVPDTSPRNVPIQPSEQENIGEGASFYVDATQAPWSKHYRMYQYVSQELPRIVSENFAVDPQRTGIFGHSMGGHGALTIALKNSNYFRSVSALAPICSPLHSAWACSALESYLGADRKLWADYDACELIKTKGWPHASILIDQGTLDPFLAGLNPHLFEQACQKAGVALHLRMQEGYNHNYYFIASFIDDHLQFHAQALND